LRLKIEKPRTYLILTVKEFYKNSQPEEYELHERFADSLHIEILVWDHFFAF
jgi:hypothetical protein